MITVYGVWNESRKEWYWVRYLVFYTLYECVAIAQADKINRDVKEEYEMYGRTWDETETWVVKIFK